MHQPVAGRRHPFFPDFLADVERRRRGLPRRAGFPVLEVHVPTALINVVNDHPRYWSDMAIPRPDSLVGVAIAAGTQQSGLDVLWNLNVGGERFGGNDGRICSRRLNKLYGNQKCGVEARMSLFTRVLFIPRSPFFAAFGYCPFQGDIF